ncbi:MAG: hypothetical protein IJ415_02530 [Clostridia bacterium]|nr:hypothetical protein [Clostridia bacterium]
MKNWHTEKITIDDTNVNFESVVPVTELIRFFQIATFNHSNEIGLDHVSMQEKSNAFWVITKMKVVLNDNIQVADKLLVTTWTHELGGVRALRDCLIKKGNSIKAKATSEWCCLDFETRKLRKMNSIHYPELEMQKTNNLNTEFTNMREEVSEKDYVYTKIVRSTDVDINNHTNNLRYNFMALDAFSVEDLKSIDMKEYEIYFVNESYEGDKIDVFKKRVKNYYYVEGRIQDKTIFRAVIKYKKKER